MMPGRTSLNPDKNAGESLRLQLLLARAGLCSRRGAEALILAGRVSLNGRVVTELGTKAGPDDAIMVDGKPLPREERKRYILLNKPAGYLCALADPERRPLAADLLKPEVRERVYNIGRLDQYSSGLIIFTNDGDFAALLGHPSGGIEKEYAILADAPLDDGFFTAFTRGIEIDGEIFRAASARRTGTRAGRIILVEGKNREIRRALESVGRRAIALRRVRIGPLLIGDLEEGRWRDLSEREIEDLRAAAGAARATGMASGPRFAGGDGLSEAGGDEE